MNFEHLRALAAVLDEGTFEAAADLLKVTPSAISQRIKALEGTVGQVLVRRQVPCTATDAGVLLLRMARQVQVLEAETASALGKGASSRALLPVAVNADSLATWFVAVLKAAADWADVSLDLHVEDQGYSSQLLRHGDVMAAVTSDPMPVSGCRVELLGHMRYVPVAAVELVRKFPTRNGVDWAAMPVLKFNTKDNLQRQLLAGKGVKTQPPTHTVPSSEGFFAAVKAGLGWGMIPELQLGGAIADSSLVLIDQAAYEDVPLYWQSWTLESHGLLRITEAVRAAGGQRLRPKVAGSPAKDAGSRGATVSSRAGRTPQK